MGRSTTDEKAKDTMHITDTTSAIILKTDWPPDGQTSLHNASHPCLRRAISFKSLSANDTQDQPK